MQNDVNTDDTDSENDGPYIDEEGWQIAFEPYEGNPEAALTLGFRLTKLKQSIRDLDMHEAFKQSKSQLTVFTSVRTFVVLAVNCLGLLSRGNSLLTEKRCFAT
jgi:hypothetical protein